MYEGFVLIKNMIKTRFNLFVFIKSEEKIYRLKISRRVLITREANGHFVQKVEAKRIVLMLIVAQMRILIKFLHYWLLGQQSRQFMYI